MLNKIGGMLDLVLLTVAALLLTAGAAQATTQIDSCQTLGVSGTYELIANIQTSNASGDCLIVNADFVTIDLNNFFIAGPGSTSVHAGVASTHKGTIVRNGVVASFQVGIRLDGSGGVVDHVVLLLNGAAVVLGDNGTVKNSTLHHSGDDAVTFVGAGGTVINNVIHEITGKGVSASGRAHITVIGNRIARTSLATLGIDVGNAGTV